MYYRAVECFNVCFIGAVKTNHVRFPKQFLELTMTTWPAGLHIIMKGLTVDSVDLLAIGYKYN